MKPGKLYGVGIGPGDPGLMTLRGAEVLRSAEVVFTVISRNVSSSVSRDVVEALRPAGEIRTLSFTMSRDPAERAAGVRANAEEVLAELRRGRDCAFATLGDAMTYSTFGYLLGQIRAALPEIEVEIVPGVNSFTALAARAGRVLVENGEDLRIIPSFRPEEASRLTFPSGCTTVLLKTYRSRAALLERLRQDPGLEVTYGERLGMEGEFVSCDPEEIGARPEEYLSMIMVKRR